MRSLILEEIHTFYDLSHILFGISLYVEEGETVCFIGRNGAGKTTTLKSIIGLAPPKHGKIIFNGEDITRKSPHIIARRGIGFIPEDRRIFSDLSVRANLEVAIKSSPNGSSPWNLKRIYKLFPILSERLNQMGGSLSGGQQQMLTIARSLMGNPKLLMIDEPSEGLSPLVVKEVKDQILELQKEGMTILLIEQNAEFALSVSTRAYVLEKGTIQYSGYTKELIENRELKKKYIGVT
jgi:branched-chain amino acid transport system ATP-binding protein